MNPVRHPYTARVFVGDCFGGVIAALIAIPYGLAMASLMGLPPVLGIFTSILTAPVTALLGRNPVLIGGTASATVPFIALAVRQQGVAGAAKICIAAALFMLLFSILRLGRYIQKVPQAVVTGFSCGIGGLMVISQLDTILGVGSPWTRSAGAPLTQLFRVLGRVGGVQAAPLVLGVLVIGAAMLSARWSARLPAPLIGVAVAVLVANVFGFHEKQVGALPLAMPAFAGFSWQRSDFTTLLPSAVGLAFVSAVNILITSRVVEHFRGWHRHAQKSDADRELGAYGLANICGGLFGAPMSVGIPARSLASVRCGATTRVSNILHAVFLIAFLEMGSKFVAQIPIPALAGVTAWMGICLLEWSTWRRLPKMRRIDAAAFLATAFAVLITNAVAAVAIGCSLFMIHNLYQRFTTSPSIPNLHTSPGVESTE
jgi:sulfate permease, SulP family